MTIITTATIVNSGAVMDGGNGRALLVADQDIVNRGSSINCATVGLKAGFDVRSESEW
jgi:hypothetical protein